MVAHLSVVEVAIVLVWPSLTVVANFLVVKQSDASAGVQSAGFGGGLIAPPGITLHVVIPSVPRIENIIFMQLSTYVISGQGGRIPEMVKPGGSSRLLMFGGPLERTQYQHIGTE
jgi:hypothetical protein